MTDKSAKKARLMRVMDEMTMELQRQGVAEVLSNLRRMARWCHSRPAGRPGEY